MFCTKFIEVADEFSLPSYVFFTSGACSLGLFNHLVSLKFEHNQDLTQYKNSEAELSVPSLSIPLPAKMLPAPFVSEGPMPTLFLSNFKRLMGTKGIMVNTFHELEPFAIQSLLNDGKSPRIYPVGPILNLSDDESKKKPSDEDIKIWLDEQPESSVVFLCFGTMGSFEPAQVKEIAVALENSGKRFLWSLRKPSEYEDFSEVLPEGFLERTRGVGRVTGWAAQVAVLAHPAVGGFVSHCGWNSTLESVWFGVPVATFPLYAEQQLNAFLLVKEMEMAEAIRIDYQRDLKGETPSEIVGAEEIEVAIRRLMAEESGVRSKVKEMQRRSRMALMEGGSSYSAQISFIEDVIRNIG
ncbi:putative UDP-glucose flavonoid 3-o-glucosyltransferase 3 [Phtheirospermum japonicum]|uniref:Putative UDP-glucose flavonoid 3-o-glucosyltransferase 3 n=1 Tax=Phtheirospermum japonicum TaxID=374723 RepID=A0A830BY69_9LAMI|nr:putative UDP-glucose flavonoid 3-o-glucosyltransferase 3 [Phtheirospermum japonicum]